MVRTVRSIAKKATGQARAAILVGVLAVAAAGGILGNACVPGRVAKAARSGATMEKVEQEIRAVALAQVETYFSEDKIMGWVGNIFENIDPLNSFVGEVTDAVKKAVDARVLSYFGKNEAGEYIKGAEIRIRADMTQQPGINNFKYEDYEITVYFKDAAGEEYVLLTFNLDSDKGVDRSTINMDTPGFKIMQAELESVGRAAGMGQAAAEAKEVARDALSDPKKILDTALAKAGALYDGAIGALGAIGVPVPDFMVRERNKLERLAEQAVALTPAERAQKVTEARERLDRNFIDARRPQ